MRLDPIALLPRRGCCRAPQAPRLLMPARWPACDTAPGHTQGLAVLAHRQARAAWAADPSPGGCVCATQPALRDHEHDLDPMQAPLRCRRVRLHGSSSAAHHRFKPDDHSKAAPPLPIPNRTVKRLCADDSAELPRESRSSSGRYARPLRLRPLRKRGGWQPAVVARDLPARGGQGLAQG